MAKKKKKATPKAKCPRCRKAQVVAKVCFLCKRRNDKSAKKMGGVIARWMRRFEKKKGKLSVNEATRYIAMFSLARAMKKSSKRSRKRTKSKNSPRIKFDLTKFKSAKARIKKQFGGKGSRARTAQAITEVKALAERVIAAQPDDAFGHGYLWGVVAGKKTLIAGIYGKYNHSLIQREVEKHPAVEYTWVNLD